MEKFRKSKNTNCLTGVLLMIELYDRTAYSLFILDIPHLTGKELETAIGYKLIGIFPGDIKNHIVRIRKNGTKKSSYLVFVLDKGADAAMRPLSPLFIRYLYNKKTAAVLYVEKKWIEFIHIQNGAIQKSTVKLRDGAGSGLLEDITNIFGGDMKTLTVFCGEPEQASFSFLSQTYEVIFVDPQKELKNIDVHAISLFSNKSPVIKRRRIIAGVFSAVLISGAVFLSYQRQLVRNEALAVQRLNQEHQKQLDEEKRRQIKQLSDLRERYREITAKKKATPFDVAKVLSECVDSASRIQSATFNDGFFQVEGSTGNSLGILQNLENHYLAQDIKLHEVKPLGGKETFIMSGIIVPEITAVDDTFPVTEQIALLEMLIAKETEYSLTDENMSPAVFGERVKTLLAKWNCAVQGYKFLNQDGKTETEYMAAGSSANFFNFLYEIHANHPAWEINLVQIRNLYPRNMLDIVFRIGMDYQYTGGDQAPPVIAEKSSEPYPVAYISRNYFNRTEPPRRAAGTAAPEVPPPVMSDSRVERAAWLEYIGTVNDDNDRRFVFVKNTRTGEVLKLEPSEDGDMRYVNTNSGGIEAFISGHVYEISRRRNE
jgi:hypothetical protein